ncbi:hypothetical protein [Streptomyces sp. NPDC007083]|uniref:hypothetical protein n=1 Tax=unclassified Streptomyces TaxID=2593676 RepID=UPI003401BC31
MAEHIPSPQLSLAVDAVETLDDAVRHAASALVREERFADPEALRALAELTSAATAYRARTLSQRRWEVRQAEEAGK